MDIIIGLWLMFVGLIVFGVLFWAAEKIVERFVK